MSKKISVIVPVYNVEKYLDKCVKSIVDQTYKNLEIVLVDDGSPDNCPQMCDEWAEKDGRIKVIHKENGGLSSARNAALEIISGDYVLFVDSDDWLESDAAEVMLSGADSHKADIVYGGFYFEKMNGPCSVQKIKNTIYENEEIVVSLLLDIIRPEVCGKMYAASLIKQFRFNEDIKYAEDLPFNFYLMLKAKRLFATGIPVYHYLQNSGNSITTAYITDSRATSWKMFADIIKKCKGNKRLEDAAYFRFTVYTFAVLSRITGVKVFRKKYFNEIADALLSNKNNILENGFVPQKHKTALKILSINKSIFRIFLKISRLAPKIIYTFKSIAAYFVIGAEVLCFSARAYFCKIRHKSNFIFLMLTPCHDNYGDHAIALAEHKLLKDMYIFEITGDMLTRLLKYPALLKAMIGKSTIVFQGGGYLGTFWFDYGEDLLRKVMKIARKNKIVVMPQSIYYEDSKWGEKQLENSQKIYAQCRNLTLTARDIISYDLMKEYYPETNVYLIPDIVLYLNKCKPTDRNGAMLTFRTDMEKSVPYIIQSKIEKFAAKRFSEVRKIDMISPYKFSANSREKELETQFERFRESEIVFTDRLHGMIFAAITGTPCVVFPNKNHKVKAVYDWLFKDCPYIYFMADLDFEKMKSFIDDVCSKSFEYDNSFLTHYYDELIKIVRGAEEIG